MALTHPDVEWQYLEGHVWRSMGAISDQIDAAFAGNAATVQYAAGPGTYTLTFADMHQENDATGYQRPVRRELSATAAAAVPAASMWEVKADVGWTPFPATASDLLTRAVARGPRRALH